MTLRKYGWIPDLPDARDFLYVPPLRAVQLPEKVDLRPWCSSVENQGAVGSCTGQAFAGALEYLDRRGDNQYTDISRLFIYYNERRLRGWENEDSGAYIRDGIKALAKWGACDEILWPYDTAKWSVCPSGEAYQDALKRKILKYSRVTSLDGVRSALAMGLPVVFGFAVYQSFESEFVAQTGNMLMPGASESLLGGHAVLAVGYDDKKKVLLVRNSWGTTWGDKGYFYMPYEYINAGLADDLWAIETVSYTSSAPDELPDDTKWYIPITGIWAAVVKIWDWLKSRKEN